MAVYEGTVKKKNLFTEIINVIEADGRYQQVSSNPSGNDGYVFTREILDTSGANVVNKIEFALKDWDTSTVDNGRAIQVVFGRGYTPSTVGTDGTWTDRGVGHFYPVTGTNLTFESDINYYIVITDTHVVLAFDKAPLESYGSVTFIGEPEVLGGRNSVDVIFASSCYSSFSVNERAFTVLSPSGNPLVEMSQIYLNPIHRNPNVKGEYFAYPLYLSNSTDGVCYSVNDLVMFGRFDINTLTHGDTLFLGGNQYKVFKVVHDVGSTFYGTDTVAIRIN